ncbi:MAG: Rieske (2Fe-2S) protein [Verrucomicrobia bacterium]|nr:MAG: Rieske (2Fe-2S) protein [Verrucomicrobiota bacterium]
MELRSRGIGHRPRMTAPTNNPRASKSDSPIPESEEHQVTRRQFAKFACCSVLAMAAGRLGKDTLLARRVATEPMQIAGIGEIRVGGYKLFRYPTEDEPCILVRLAENRFVAYSQSCTHLMCPVSYQHENKQFYCPCHEGFFDAEDGHVVAGPPRRPLPEYPVETRGDKIWVLPPLDPVS